MFQFFTMSLASFSLTLLVLMSRNLLCHAKNPVQEPLLEAFNGRKTDLFCNHPNIQINEYIFWYRQFPSQPPHFIVRGYQEPSKSIIEQVSLIVAHNRKNSTLSFINVAFEDQALYFCALGDRQYGGGSSKLTFGAGTKLHVIPNLDNSEPSVYQLESKKESSDLAACLITDYSPDPINVQFNNLKSEEVNGSAVVVKDGDKESASLGVVIWRENKDQLQCSATYNGQTYKAEKEGDATCSETQSDTPVFETDERLNLLSITVLGLRLIFFKSIALNLLLTYWAWSR